MKIEDYPITWNCRFHPTNWWHETGCPHMQWTVEQLQSALETMKRNMAYHLDLFREHPDVLMKMVTALPAIPPQDETPKEKS